MISLKELSIFTRNLAVMIRSGLSLTEALEIVESQSKGKFKVVIKNLIATISAGNPLSEALLKYPKIFKNYYISTLKAGESSGKLEENLFNLADQIDKSYSLRQKIKSASIYPVVVIVLSIVIGFLLTLFVLPKITPLFLGLDMELPFLTRVLIAVSDFMRDYGLWFSGFLILMLVVLFQVLKIKSVKYFLHQSFLSLPFIKKISQSKSLAEFSYTFGTMLKSGLSFDEALEISASTIANLHYQKKLLLIKERVNEGKTLSDSLAEYPNLFPVMAIGMIRVGEKAGNLDEELINLSGLYERDTDNIIQGLAASIEPILLIVIGLVVGLLAVAVITPIYNITGSVYT
jgi:type IV pilus assembly protein PilC